MTTQSDDKEKAPAQKPGVPFYLLPIVPGEIDPIRRGVIE